MNAIIGDNGIITKAQEANVQNSIAMLEEYLQLKYTENYEANVSNDSKVIFLKNKYPEFFFKVTLGYMPVSDETGSYSLYLINKSGLPEEIRTSLLGGDAGEGTYTDYATLNDVYGVTSNLKVYYCKSGLSSIKGVQVSNLDAEDMDKVLYNKSDAMSNFLSGYDTDGDGEISIKESRAIKSLTVDSTNMVSDFSNFYNLINLQELNLKNVTLNNLNGIENCTKLNYIYIENCKIDNYSAIGKLGNRLNYLYLYNITDGEIAKMCSKDSTGIGSYDLEKLQYLGIVGNTRFLSESADRFAGVYQAEAYKSKSTNVITTLSSLENLSTPTKQAVFYLSLQNNNIGGNLESIKEFKNIRLLRVENNDLSSLDGIENLKNLKQIYAYYNSKITALPKFMSESELNIIGMQYCSLENLNGLENCNELIRLYFDGNKITNISSLSDKVKLSFLSLTLNKNLSNIDALEELNDLIETNGDNYIALEELYLEGCSNSISAGGILKLIAKCGTKYSLPNGVKVLTGSVYDVSQYYDPATVSYDELHSDLYNNSYILKLSLRNVKCLTNDEFNTILSSMKNLVYLDLRYCTTLTSLNFVGKDKVEKLQQLDLVGTNVIDLSNLKEYGLSLVNLRLDNIEMDLTNIQGTISRLHFMSDGWQGWNNLSDGLYLGNDTLFKKLSSCNKITTINSYLPSVAFTSDVDLRSCTSLQEVVFREVGSKILLPSSVRSVYVENCPLFTLEAGTLLDYLGYFYMSSQEEFDSFVENIRNVSSITNLEILYFNNLSSLNSLSNLSNAKISNLNLGTSNTLKVHPERFSNNTFKDLGGITSISSLEGIFITKSALSDISGIENLSNLKSLEMPYNSITSGLKFLENKDKLTTIDFSNNLILNTSSYVEGGQTKSCDVVKIFVNLRKQGSLQTLKLAGNGIDNWGELETLDGWNSETESGF